MIGMTGPFERLILGWRGRMIADGINVLGIAYTDSTVDFLVATKAEGRQIRSWLPRQAEGRRIGIEVRPVKPSRMVVLRGRLGFNPYVRL